jgi:hypothetical protein
LEGGGVSDQLNELDQRNGVTAPPKAPRMTYAQLGWVFVLAWLAYVFGMSMFVSEHMASSALARAFSNWMANYIPMLDNIQKIPGASQWVRFFYSIMWAITPLFLLIGWSMRRAMIAQQIYLQPFSDLRLILSAFGIALLVSIALWWPVDDGRGWRDQAAISRGFGVAHFALGVFGFSLGIGGYLRLMYARIKFGNVTEIVLKGN